MDLASVCYSQKYVWLKNDIIAKGTFTTIYQAKRQEDGNMVALKWYEIEINDSELHEVRKLNHENLVKLFDIEKETKTDQVVVAMEWCTDGHLGNILQQRKHAFGFEENEFLLLLGNLTEGLDYLKKNYGIYRDIRPENIMRTTKPNGISLYKLIDYEAELDNYGHMEEINLDDIADYYDRVCKKNNSRMPDLWSVGAILYHAAAGCVPFKCADARKDIMIRMLSQKKHEHISGRQYYKHGRFEYTQSLPVSTPLNTTLQNLLVPVLVMLLDTDEQTTPSLEKFVAMSKSITSKIKVRIFTVNLVKEHVFHLDNNYSLQDIQKLIEEQTDFNPDDYLVFCEDKVLSKSDLKTQVQNNVIHEFTVFDITDDSPIDGFARKFKPGSNDFKCGFQGEDEENSFKEIYRIAYDALVFISEKLPVCEWCTKSVQQFCTFLSNEIIALELQCRYLRISKKFIEQTDQFRKIVEHISQIKYDLIYDIKFDVDNLNIKDLLPYKTTENKLLVDWRRSCRYLLTNCLTQSISEAKNYLSHIDKSVTRIRQLDKLKINDFHSNQIHSVERKHIIKMRNNMVDLAQVVEKDYQKLMDLYAEWHMKAYNIYAFIKKIEKELDDYREKLFRYRCKVEDKVNLKDLQQLNIKKILEDKAKGDFEVDMEMVYHSDVPKDKSG